MYKPDDYKLVHSIKDKQGIQVPCPAESRGDEPQEVGFFLYLEQIPEKKGDTELNRTVMHITKYFLYEGVRYAAWRKIKKPPWRLWDDVEIDITTAPEVAAKMFELAGQKVVHKSTDKMKAELEASLQLMGIR